MGFNQPPVFRSTASPLWPKTKSTSLVPRDGDKNVPPVGDVPPSRRCSPQWEMSPRVGDVPQVPMLVEVSHLPGFLGPFAARNRACFQVPSRCFHRRMQVVTTRCWVSEKVQLLRTQAHGPCLSLPELGLHHGGWGTYSMVSAPDQSPGWAAGMQFYLRSSPTWPGAWAKSSVCSAISSLVVTL